MELDDNILPIVGKAQRILDQQLRTRPIHRLNITIIDILIDNIKLDIIILIKKWGLSHLKAENNLTEYFEKSNKK